MLILEFARDSGAGPLSVTITNVARFQCAANQSQHTNYPVRLEGVVCWSDLAQGQIVLQDDSGTELIEMDPQIQPIRAGDKIRVEGESSGGRGGVSLNIGNVSLIDDRIQLTSQQFGALALKAGRYPISVSWFDGNNLDGLDVFFEGPGMARQSIPDSYLFHELVDEKNGDTNWIQGLNYRAYEGQWSWLPDFQKLNPVSVGISANFNIALKPRNRNVDWYLTVTCRFNKTGSTDSPSYRMAGINYLSSSPGCR